MTAEEAMAWLKANSDPKAKRVWEDFGLKTPDEYWGSQMTKLKDFAKKAKKNHEVALQLWASGIHDAKLLSCFLDEPKKVTREQVERQSTEIHFIDVANRYAGLLGQTAMAAPLRDEWTSHEDEMKKRMGFGLIIETLKSKNPPTVEQCLAWLRQIETELQAERNWVKEMMAYALIAIGSHSPLLNAEAIKVAERLGKIMIDYGVSSCKDPEPLKALKAPRLQAALNK